MSYATLMSVIDGEVVATDHEYRNSHGLYTATWQALARRYYYYPEGVSPYTKIILHPFDNWERLWDEVASGDLEIEPWEFNVLCCTYDYTLILGKSVPIVAESLARFDERYRSKDKVGHWQAMARDLNNLNGADAIGYEMSITDQWSSAGHYDENTDETKPYNINTGSLHRWAEIRVLA